MEINLIQSVFLILTGTLALMGYHSPKALRHLAVRALTRAQVIEAAKQAHSEGLAEWRGQLGIDHERQARAVAIREAA